MTLDSLAAIYKEQLLDKLYFIIVEYPRRMYVLNSSKANFLHLTGLQRSEEFKHFKPKEFWEFCVHDNREISSLTFQNGPDRNMALLKTSTFDNCYKAIHNLGPTYVSDKNLICATECTNIGKKKLFSISFLKQSDETWCPVTVQVDKDIESSTMIKQNEWVLASNILDADKETVIKAMRKYDKTVNEVKELVMKKITG